MLKPEETRQRMYRFIGVSEAAPAAGDAEPVPGHVTSADPRASVGRWRQDLSAEEADLCRKLFGTYMKRFGYDD